jgi:drug/metabolite transporter (DMT)-like permease
VYSCPQSARQFACRWQSQLSAISNPTMQTSHICVDNPVESEHSYGQQFLIGFLFSVSSVGMILVNKAAVSVLSHAGFLLLLQNLVTILLVWSLYPEVAASLKKSWRWFPCAILFSLNIFSSLQCLYFVSVATFTVLRNTQPIIAAGIDHSFRREITRPERIFSSSSCLSVRWYTAGPI